MFVAMLAVLVLVSCVGKNETEMNFCGALEAAKGVAGAYAENLEKVIETEDAEAYVKLYEKFIDDRIGYFEKFSAVLYNTDLYALAPEEKEKAEALAAEIENLEITVAKLELDAVLSFDFTDEQETRLDEADSKLEAVYSKLYVEESVIEPDSVDAETL